MMRGAMNLFAVLAVLVTTACGKDRPQPDAVDSSASTSVVLDSAQRASAGITLWTVGSLPPDTIQLTGTITFDAGKVSHVGPRVQGRIRRVLVDVGTRVRTGDTLVVLDSPELGAAQARWMQARVGRDVAARNNERTERLFAEGIVSQRRRLEVEAEFRDREASLIAALQALSSLGAEPDSSGSGLFVIRAPLNGEVVEKHATVGEIVGPETSLFVVGELSALWLVLDLYETDLPRVRANQRARVVPDAYPDRVFDARVALISSTVDTVSRTVKVRLELANADHLLRPGLFARAGIVLDPPAGALGIPHAAVQRVDEHDVVFMPDGSNRFTIRPVTVGAPRAGGWVSVLDGVSRGDSIVVGGSFTLKAHLQTASAPGEP